MIHNRYMEMSIITGQVLGFTEPLKFAPCVAGCHVSLCFSAAGGVCSGWRDPAWAGRLECCRAPCSPPFKSQSQGASDKQCTFKITINVERR